MALEYTLETADVAAVYIRTGREGQSSYRLRLAPYLLVTYATGESGIVPYPDLPVPGAGVPVYTVKDFEVDRIEVYDTDPYSGLTSFGIF